MVHQSNRLVDLQFQLVFFLLFSLQHLPRHRKLFCLESRPVKFAKKTMAFDFVHIFCAQPALDVSLEELRQKRANIL
jgi:hypothetical protein